MDNTLTQWINASAGASPLFDSVALAITKFGVPAMIVAVVAQWWLAMDRQRVRHAAVSAGLSFLLGLAVNQAILLFVHRVRPYDAGVSHLLIAYSADWSFPSDHATAAFSIVFAFMLCGLGSRACAFAAAALLVCWSRVYVGTHYVSDVVGGAATGLLAAAIVRLGYRRGTRLDRMLTSIL